MGNSQIQSGAKADGVVTDILMGMGKTGDVNTPDEQEAVKLVGQLYQKSKQWKQTWAKDHDRFWNLWESNHYKGRVAHTLTQAVINQVWSSIETVLGHVVDALPEPIARARQPIFKEKAKLCTKWLKYEHDQNNLEQEIQHPVRESCVVGAGWLKVPWDETKYSNRGDALVLPVDGKFMFPSPYARNIPECLYIIEAKNVPRDYVVRTWEKGEKVPPGTWDGTLNNLRSYSEANRDSQAPNVALLTTTTGSDSHWSNSTGVTGGKSSDLVTLMEAWIRQEDGDIRLIIVANGVVLQDGPSPYDDKEFPYAVVNVLPTMDTIQGRGLVQFIEGLQDILNASLSYLLDQQRFASDPMLIVKSINLEDGQLVDNSPGAVLPDSDPNGQGYNWLTAPGFNQAWVQIQEIITGYMDSVLGRVDVLKGESPAGIKTLGGLEIIRDEANIRLRSLIRWVKASLKRVDLLILSRLRQFAKDERTLRITGKLGQEEFVTVNPVTGVTPDGGLERDLTLPEEAEFDIEFGKDIPGGRQAEIELALQLAATPAEDGLPMVDRQFVLEKAILDEAPEVLERMAQMAQMQAQQQQQAAAAQAGAQGGVAGQPPAGNPMDQVMQMFTGGQAA